MVNTADRPARRNHQPNAAALTTHLSLLRQEQERLAQQIVAVEDTITALQGDAALMAETMFNGFDHTQYKAEVEQRWGEAAYARSDGWWRGLSDAERQDWMVQVKQLNADWAAAAAAEAPHITVHSPEAQELAARHIAWLRGVPGTPAARPDGDLFGYVRGLAEMYVADERFAANYGGVENATFVRDALRAYIDDDAPKL